jgi:DNA polymerase-3 subunit gamma/tau
LVCDKPAKGKDGQFEPCNECESCKLILSGQTSDLIEIDAASNRGIEDIRELREQVQYHPMQLKRKIYIIDEVHMLTTEAFNALLKTLEEPPEYSLFILATTELHKVPLTIRSRCQLVRFQRGSMDSLSQKLQKVAAAEKLSADPEVFELLAEHADGAFRDAETLLESLSTQHSHLTLDLVRESLGLLPQKHVEQLLAACLSGDNRTVMQLLREYQPGQGAVERFISQMIEKLRQASFARSQATDIPDFASEASLELLAYSLDQLMEAYILQRSAPLPALPLEIACLNISSRAGGTHIQAEPEPIKATTHAPSRPAEKPAVSSTVVIEQPRTEITVLAPKAIIVDTPTNEAPAVAPVVELRTDGISDPRKAWRQMIDKISQENIVLGQTIKQTVFHTAENGVITIHVRYKFHVDKMSEKKNHSRILDLLRELSGQDWNVQYVVSNAVPRQTPHKEIGDGLANAEAVFGTPPN